MGRDELAYWLRLSLTPGVGNSGARRLLAAFGLPEAIFKQSHTALCQIISPAQASALKAVPAPLPALLDSTWAWLQTPPEAGPGAMATDRVSRRVSRRVLALGDPAYPAELLDIEDPPLLLYLMGQCQALDLPVALGHADAAQKRLRALAIVGSRNPTPQGASHARQFAKTLAGAGLTIVSGLALGVDAAAHEGALEGFQPGGDDLTASGLATIAVVGTGLDRVYPKQHRDLAHRIARHGLLISEYALGTPPLAAHFPQRNRLISGLSLGTLVVEAALKSGSLITARMAAEQGREVLAIPGSIHVSQSRGCHQLIKQGAKLVESAADVLEELRLPPQAGPAPASTLATALADTATSSDAALLRLMGHDPVSLDALQARSGESTATLQARLLSLELEGAVGRLPGGLFQRVVAT